MLRSLNLASSTATRTVVSASSASRQTLIGPAVRLLLHDYQIDPKHLEPSGPKGNLLKSDVLSHISRSKLKPKPSAPKSKSDAQPLTKTAAVGSQKRLGRQKYEDIPIKQATGDRKPGLTEAHYSLTSELIVDDLFKEIEKFEVKSNSANATEDTNSLFNSFVRKASTVACQRVPEANLIIEPFVSLNQGTLQAERNEGRLHSNEFEVSNLGSFNSVDHFTPTGQPESQTYTLAVGRTQKRLVLSDEGIKQVTTVKVTLSCDHRAVDTHIGAEWFKHFKRLIEHPSTIFL